MKKVTVIVFLMLIYFLSVLNIFSDDVVFSENENRYLNQFPEISIKDIFDGSFSEGFEKYIQDQMFSRSEFIEIKANFNLNVFGRIQNNNVYAGNENLVNQFILNDDTIMYNNIGAVNDVDFDMDVMIIPTHSAYENTDISSFAYNTDQKMLLEKIDSELTKNYINVYYDLSVGDDNFFSTDHHWNINGAYLGYQAYCESAGLPEMNYNFTEVSDDFKGSLYSKSGLFSFEGEYLFTIDELDEYDLELIIDGETGTSVFFPERLEEKDKYTYYLDGNHSFIEIHNNNVSDNSSLLVIKDSYANIFVPMLVPHYEDIYIVDLRYYHSAVSELISENDIENVLLLYNTESFVTDENIRFLR